VFRHIVLFRVRDDVTDPELSEAIDRLRALGDAPTVGEWRIERSLDQRKGRVIVEDATFASREAFEVFRSSAAHVATAEHMAGIADWWVGDYELTGGAR
jgi:hypothetical protein